MKKRGSIKISHIPHLINEWDWGKNEIDPSKVSRGSIKKRWWICDKGHSFYMSPNSRTNKTKKQNCPYCSGRKVIKGKNDLLSKHPELKELWDWEKNEYSPEEMSYSTQKEVFLKCSKGHSFSRKPSNSTKSKITCRKCTGYYITSETSVLAKIGDDANHLWSEKNKIGPKESKSDDKKNRIWWKCELGHEWQCAALHQLKRYKKDDWCPICSNRKLLPGFNDLLTRDPKIANLLVGKDPKEVLFTSSKRMQFKCLDYDDHIFTASPSEMLSGKKCTYCIGRKLKVGFNDFATIHPDLASKVSPQSINQPHEMTSGSNKKMTFICDKGHKYECSAKNASAGWGCPYCSSVRLSYENTIENSYPEIASRFSQDSKYQPHEVSIGSQKKVTLICKNNPLHSYDISCHNILRWDSCPHCPRNNDSKPEKELYDYVSSITKCKVIHRKTGFLSERKELDIYIPELSIAIEFNGIYWHTEKHGKGRKYHYSKWKECRDKGIQLITIWEDEWRDKKDIVKSMLAHKLGVSQDRRVYARKTKLVSLNSSIARKFLEDHHIQGFSSGSIYIGLENGEGEIIAVSSWRKNKDILYLDRYATSCVVVGGMGKLLKAGKEFAQENECSKIVTFSDHRVSDGSLYKKLGFEEDKEIPPDYRYFSEGKRKHKFGYRLKKFKNDPSLIYQPGLTERELAELNGLERIWDCGKTRWVIEVS